MLSETERQTMARRSPRHGHQDEQPGGMDVQRVRWYLPDEQFIITLMILDANGVLAGFASSALVHASGWSVPAAANQTLQDWQKVAKDFAHQVITTENVSRIEADAASTVIDLNRVHYTMLAFDVALAVSNAAIKDIGELVWAAPGFDFNARALSAARKASFDWLQRMLEAPG